MTNDYQSDHERIDELEQKVQILDQRLTIGMVQLTERMNKLGAEFVSANRSLLVLLEAFNRAGEQAEAEEEKEKREKERITKCQD